MGRGDDKKAVKVRPGARYREALVEAFPEETKAIDKFFEDLKVRNSGRYSMTNSVNNCDKLDVELIST